MKNIFFLRHAKSSWDDFALKDFDRPLSTRGIQDADLMGNFFKSKKHKIVTSSPIICKDDPSLMFVNAGMVTFKDYLLGNKKPLNKAQ